MTLLEQMIEEYGIEKGEEKANQLNRCLAEQGRLSDIIRAASDREYQKELYKEFGL